jgi:hypothetical protein
MLRHGRSALRSLARDWHKVALGAAVGLLAGGAIVSADSGDASLVHGCVFSATGTPSGPNVRIVGENDACPGGSTAKHWSIQGPPGGQGPQGPAAQVTPDAVANATKIEGLAPPRALPSRRQLKKLTAHKIKTVKLVKGPDLFPSKIGLLFCPPGYPTILTGGITMFPPQGQASYSVVQNAPVAQHGWFANVIRYGSGFPWRLTIEAVCKQK